MNKTYIHTIYATLLRWKSRIKSLSRIKRAGVHARCSGP